MFLNKQYKRHIATFLLISITALTGAPSLRAANKEHKEQILKPAQSTPETNMEAAMTLTELQEILYKIKEDLDERIDLIEDQDSSEIAQILIKRRQIIMDQITKLHGLDEEAVNMYMEKIKKNKNSNKLFWGITLTVAAVASAALITASYDADSGTLLNRPSLERLQTNLGHVTARIKQFLSNGPTQEEKAAAVRTAEQAQAAEQARVAAQVAAARAAEAATEQARAAAEQARVAAAEAQAATQTAEARAQAAEQARAAAEARAQAAEQARAAAEAATQAAEAQAPAKKVPAKKAPAPAPAAGAAAPVPAAPTTKGAASSWRNGWGWF